MLFGQTTTIYCENHKEHTGTLCGQNAKFQYVTAGGTQSNHRASYLQYDNKFWRPVLCVLMYIYMYNTLMTLVEWQK
jgi:hypothetical protein